MAVLAYIGQVTHLKKVCQILRATVCVVRILKKLIRKEKNDV